MTAPRFIVSAVLAALVAFGNIPGQGRAAEPLTIDVIVSKTGQGAFLGQEEAQALEVLETVTNHAGGIGGRPIHFAISDSQSSPQVAVQLADAALAHHPSVILGSSLTAECNAIAAIVEKTGPVEFCFSPGIRPASGSYVFADSPGNQSLMQVAQRFFHDRGWNKVATLVTTDASGQDADNAITATFGPGTLVDREHYAVNDLSVDAQMARIKSSGADAVMVWATGAPFATALRSARNVGLTIPMLASPANLVYAAMAQWSPFMYSPLYFVAFPFVDVTQASDFATKRAIATMNDAFNAIGVRPDVGQTLGWDAGAIVLDAFRHLGADASAVQIRDYIAGIGRTHAFTGIYGRYDFVKYPDRGVGPENVIVARWEPQRGAWIAASRPGGMPATAVGR